MSLIISDSSPLISLDRAGFLHLVRSLYGTVIVPPAVQVELKGTFDPKWMTVRVPRYPIPMYRHLDRGETEAIWLALEMEKTTPVTLLIDERAGRKEARQLGIPIQGVLGLLIEAKNAGLIRRVAEIIDILRRGGGRYDDSVVLEVLRLAGEEP